MEKYFQKFNNASNDNGDEGNEADTETVNKKARKGSSEVWNFFESSKDKSYAKCRSCGKIYKTSGNTSNLLDHLKRAHPGNEKNCKPSKTIESFFKSVETYSSDSVRKKIIDRALIAMIATDLQPFSIVEDKGFRELIKILDPRYVLPSRPTLQNVMMASLYSNIKEKLQTMLDEIEHCAVTTDCWTSRANEGYLTVTCHFMTKDYILRSAVLSTQKLLVATNHNAENIAISLRTVLDSWGVMRKVAAVVTDNDSTMIKACELLQKRHLPCFAHTINLVVQDSLSQENIKIILVKCKRIVTYFKSSTVAYEKFKADQGREKPYSLLQEVPTRWNSALKMIERILVTNSSISNVLLATPKAPLPLTADDIEVLKDLKELLTPFDAATIQTSSSTSVTISLVIPIICGLYQSINEIKTKLTTLEGQQTCSFLIERIKKRLFPYEERTITRIGTLLDPRFKKEGFLFSNNSEKGTLALQNELSTMNKKNAFSYDTEPSTSRNVQQEAPELLKFVGNKVASKVRTKQVDAIICLRQYLENENSSIESDPLQYWKCSGNEMLLTKLCALRYLCVPATSTESERMFSKAGSILSDRRSCLKPKNLNMLLFINKNYWVSQ